MNKKRNNKKICPACGAIIDKDKTVCPYCGEVIRV